MAYDLTKLTRLQALQELARRAKAEMDRNHSSILDAMYQAPVAVEYRTKGNLTHSGTGSILDETLGGLLDLSGLTADSEGKYAFTLNGQPVGSYTAETKLSQLMDDINRSGAGVEAGYSETGGEFRFTARETGTAGQIAFGEGLAQAMFAPGGSGSESPSFARAYGIDWVGNEEDQRESAGISFEVLGADFSVEITITKDDTIQSVAGKLNRTSSFLNKGCTASCNPYTGRLEVRDQSGAAAEPRISDADDENWELTFDETYKPDVSYTPGQDGIFTAVKVNGKVLKVNGKAVDISEYIGAATPEPAADAEVDEMLNEVFGAVQA